MERSELRKLLIAVIKKYQRLSGDDFPDELEAEGESCSMGKVEGFDSIRGAEVTSELKKELDDTEIDLGELTTLLDPQSYDDTDHFEDITLGQVLNRLELELT